VFDRFYTMHIFLLSDILNVFVIEQDGVTVMGT